MMRRVLALANRLLGGRIARHAMELADAAWAAGDPQGARAACDTALALEPANNGALTLSAYLELPGPDYRAALAAIHAAVRPRTYVEIGIAEGDSLRLAGPNTRAIGIDPAPELTAPVGANTAVLRLTSDEAFASGALRNALGDQPIDLAFIDGMHRCEFALRDFMNLERLCAPGATVLLHDCYPLNRLTAERERRTAFWSGDTWRIVPTLKKYRPDLVVRTLAAAPTGLAIVRGLNPGSTALHERYDAIVADMLALDFSLLEDGRKAAALNRCANDWGEIAALLAA